LQKNTITLYFSTKIGQKSPKIGKKAVNCDHNIDPRWLVMVAGKERHLVETSMEALLRTVLAELPRIEARPSPPDEPVGQDEHTHVYHGQMGTKFIKKYFFVFKSYHPIPWRDSISRPIDPVTSVAGGGDMTRPRRKGKGTTILSKDELFNIKIYSLGI
jgi:hypothetical protein